MHNLGKREERGIGKVLIVIDMQNDFVTGTLGNQEAQAIVPNVQAKVKEYADRGDWIILTRDTHEENYLAQRFALSLPTARETTSLKVLFTPRWAPVLPP